MKGTGALPADGFCVLGVTLIDLFCSDDDVFTSGLASPSEHAGVFSFYRYREALPRGDTGRLLSKACNTAAHEVLHMFGIGHCLHRACLMNGSGHVREDFAAPPYLCPVDLAKLKAALGPRCSLLPRYHALLAFCTAQPSGFDEQAAWIRSAIAAAGGSSGGAAPQGNSDSSGPARHSTLSSPVGGTAATGTLAEGSCDESAIGAAPPTRRENKRKKRAVEPTMTDASAGRGVAAREEAGSDEEELAPLARRLAGRKVKAT